MAGVTILTVTDLEKRYISDLIFSGLTFQVGEGEHIGIVGPNGVGKSTLLKIIAGIEPTSGGTVAPLRGLKITYLAQEARFDSDRDVREETLQAFAHLHRDRTRARHHYRRRRTRTIDGRLRRRIGRLRDGRGLRH
jgi:ATP-binding cassette subfamily F protein 3